ncbi:MAG: endonuclease III domain-containing protein [Lamprobacter sp.]|uniref:endonuclease III domain-containing protein n=1 Tax=Lamprobacter sp. TaxID=3100796 RepID=UPI002B26363D|nr:endonuclease III domain-containing protein [Lamprobacter sp.]MEA3640053.1 endonuclease III domain-containing protein [Lamprobacter sp.]
MAKSAPMAALDGHLDAPFDASLHASPDASLFASLFAAYGEQHWWPAETPFEVMLGAVLTQNTAWTNVERALNQLRAQIPLSPEALLALEEPVLAELIRPSGYFNVKARRLRSFCSALIEAGGETALSALPTDELRRWLLAINGIGPETADDILLYAFERPVFVVDAYTRRLFRRLGLIAGDEDDEQIRQRVETALGPDTACFNEYHALIVRHAKEVCRARKPDCERCLLRPGCQQREGD